jgi:large subunit ribosomal protein L29
MLRVIKNNLTPGPSPRQERGRSKQKKIIMKIKELRVLGPNELHKQLAAMREQVRDLSFKIHSREVKNNHMLNVVKKDIARILTIINEKK